MNDPYVSVVICAYSDARWDNLTEAVGSLRQQTVASLEIIVVIDHNEPLLQSARQLLSESVVIENSEQRGLSGARNSGIRAARGELIAFLDDDAVAAPDWLERLIAAYDTDDVMGVGGAIEPLWPSLRPRWFPTEFDWVVGCTYRGMPVTRSAVRNVIGANMSFRREVFDEIGFFHSGVGRVDARPVGCDETELCIRAHQHWPRRTIIYEPSARVNHRVTPARASWEYFRSRCYAEGLSKALITTLVGSGDSLASERSYTFRTLPIGVARGVLDAAVRNDPLGLARAGAIVGGLLITVFGYFVGHVSASIIPERAENRHMTVSKA